MKHWMAVLWLAVAAGGLTWLRKGVRDRVVDWGARRSRGTQAQGRHRALALHGGVFLGAVVVLAAGFLAWHLGGRTAWLRYPPALAVVFGYVPVAMVAAPKLTKWQKSHEQRLIAAGAARDGARGWDAVARVFSVLGAVLGFAALFLLVVPT